MKELKVEATIDNIPVVTEFVTSQLDEMSCIPKAKTQIRIAIDEIFGNIAHYAYEGKTGPAWIRVEQCEEQGAVVITFTDEGIPYNPCEKSDPDISLSIEERQIGGLGIYMVKKLMDDVWYEYKDGKNMLSLKKIISSDET